MNLQNQYPCFECHTERCPRRSGATGPTGPTGPQGPAGPSGSDGAFNIYSAVDVALSQTVVTGTPLRFDTTRLSINAEVTPTADSRRFVCNRAGVYEVTFYLRSYNVLSNHIFSVAVDDIDQATMTVSMPQSPSGTITIAGGTFFVQAMAGDTISIVGSGYTPIDIQWNYLNIRRIGP